MRSAIIDRGTQPIINLAANTLAIANTTNASQIGGSQPANSTDTTAANRLFGSASFTKTRAAGSGVGALGVKGSTVLLDRPLKTGDVLRWGCWLRANVATTIAPYWERTDGGTYTGASGGGSVTLPANTWVWGTGSFTVNSATEAFAVTRAGCGFFGSAYAEGTQVWWNGLIITLNQALPPTYCDGSTPGWKWLGTAGLSASVGQPYTLESIAGKPLYFGENVAASLTTLATIPSGPFTVVSSQTAPTTNTPGLWNYELNSGLRTRRLLSTVSGTPVYRADSGKPDNTIMAATINWDPTVQRALVARCHDNGIDMVLDGTVQAVQNAAGLNPVSGGTFKVGVRDGQFFGVIQTYGVAVYPYYMNDETAKRVTGWFARRYGTPVPAGY